MKSREAIGAHVLVDEVYLEACYDPAARSAFHLGPNFVITSSLTKAYGLSGLRCGWILAAPQLAERMWKLNDLFGVMPAHSAELLSVIALEHLPEIAARSQSAPRKKSRSPKEFVSNRATIWSPSLPDAGTIVFPQLARGRADAFCQLLRDKYETSVVPGRFFEIRTISAWASAWIRNLDEGLRRIGAALDEYANSR